MVSRFQSVPCPGSAGARHAFLDRQGLQQHFVYQREMLDVGGFGHGGGEVDVQFGQEVWVQRRPEGFGDEIT